MIMNVSLSVLAGLHHREIDYNPERIYNVCVFEKIVMIGVELKFPLKLNDIHIFEKDNNNIAITVYGLDDNENVMPWIRSKFRYDTLYQRERDSG